MHWDGVAEVRGGREGRRKFGGVMDTFIILIVVMVSRACTYVETHPTVHFKCVQVVVSQLYRHKIAKTKVSGE